ncbi:ribosomal large subunit pseudouridine synthase B [bacterium BMS3Bbin04]|nr:ribosomal large subunit pseudouridine synthase B [bacterium BMS3Bbin04]
MLNSNSDKDDLIRLSALLSKRGIASRRKAEELMVEGRVLVNGQPVRELGTKVDPATAIIEVDGQKVQRQQKHIYLALNKPPGVLSTFVKDKERGATLQTLIPLKQRLFSAGRLDRASSGLLILTSDGDWANFVMHPRYEKEKEYLVRFKGMRPTPAAKMMQGASFREEGREFTCEGAEPVGSYVRIILTEGRKNHIRRLGDSVDLTVKELVRVRIGEVQLGSLKPGGYRKLSTQEVESFRK